MLVCYCDFLIFSYYKFLSGHTIYISSFWYLKQITLRTNDLFIPTNPATSSIIDLSINFFINFSLSYFADSTAKFRTFFILEVIADRIAFPIIDFTKNNFSYRKLLIAKDLTNCKLYIKKAIRIKKIWFSKMVKVLIYIW